MNATTPSVPLFHFHAVFGGTYRWLRNPGFAFASIRKLLWHSEGMDYVNINLGGQDAWEEPILEVKKLICQLFKRAPNS